MKKPFLRRLTKKILIITNNIIEIFFKVPPNCVFVQDPIDTLQGMPYRFPQGLQPGDPVNEKLIVQNRHK